jgi:hypothetical protein
MIRNIRIFIWSLDTLLASLGALVAFLVLPRCVDSSFSVDILSVGISVLSIVFSIFFASLTFIISSSNDNFVDFLNKKGHLDEIILMYRWTLASLFVSLIYSISSYSYVSYVEISGESVQRYIIILFAFLFIYSLVASLLSTESAIKYAKRRAEFIRISEDSEGDP